jgi:SAM-dependent methyltransferase
MLWGQKNLFALRAGEMVYDELAMLAILAGILGRRAALLWRDPSVYTRLNWLKKRLLPGPVRTLDIGCAAGYYTFYASSLGNRTVGVDTDARGLKKARKVAGALKAADAEFYSIDLKELNRHAEELGQFDQIICTEVLEHILDDARLLQDLSRLLSPGGRLLLTTPFKFGRRATGEILSQIEDGGHVRWGYTHQELGDLLRGSGIDVISEEFIGGIVTDRLTRLFFILSKINKKAAWLTVTPFRALEAFDPALTKMRKYPCGSVAVVGVKRV